MSKFFKESTTYFVRGHVCRWNIQKMQSESNEYERKTSGFFTNSLENQNSLRELLCRLRERSLGKHWMDAEVQTTLLNTYPPELLATIPKALREQLKENDQPNAVEDCRLGTRNLLNTIKS